MLPPPRPIQRPYEQSGPCRFTASIRLARNPRSHLILHTSRPAPNAFFNICCWSAERRLLMSPDSEHGVSSGHLWPKLMARHKIPCSSFSPQMTVMRCGRAVKCIMGTGRKKIEAAKRRAQKQKKVQQKLARKRTPPKSHLSRPKPEKLERKMLCQLACLSGPVRTL